LQKLDPLIWMEMCFREMVAEIDPLMPIEAAASNSDRSGLVPEQPNLRCDVNILYDWQYVLQNL